MGEHSAGAFILTFLIAKPVLVILRIFICSAVPALGGEGCPDAREEGGTARSRDARRGAALGTRTIF